MQLAQQATGAATTFLHWRSLDRSGMGVVALCEALLADRATLALLIDDLAAMALQRIALNMQVDFTRNIARQAWTAPGRLRSECFGPLL